MVIKDFLSRKRTYIVKRCLNLIMETYPPESSEVFEYSGDRFRNPVGFTIRDEVEHIFNELAGEMDTDSLNSALENIIRIRAVQGFPPSEAISFVFLLKKAIREEITKDGFEGINNTKPGSSDKETETLKGLLQLEEKIDRIALLAFDIYMKCREKIHEIRLKEIKRAIR